MDNLNFTQRVLRVKEKKVYNDTQVDDEIEGKRKFNLEEKLNNEKFNRNLSDILIELNGEDFELKYIQEHGFNTPILFKKPDGLGLRVPDSELFGVNDVKSYVGARRMIDVFDCDTHQADQMSVHQWIRYYTGTDREKILNVTSLEFSHTGLDRIVECPKIVREDLDWVTQVWPKNLIAEQKDTTNTIENMKYPKVKKYVLMSVAGCYTDFHIDFGGTSVWYHILKGAKVFWLIPPTENNLKTYERWMLSECQQDVFLGDMVEQCYRVHLVAGDTFMLPTGWMETEVFADWFHKFADSVKERPLLLLLDGHLTHISIPVISRALDENIIIMRFPPHVTDVLQPLDVSCFGPLKRKWEELLQDRVNTFGPKHQLTKSDFVNQLCKIWTIGMKEENVKNGFLTTGWIHGVYTPDDSLVFGGNFLHSFNIPMQLKAYDIEENAHVPRRLRYPFFSEIHWYMIKAYVDVLEKDLDERRILEFEGGHDIEDDDSGAFKLVKEEIDEVVANEKERKKKWECVYLTVYELEGLKLLCERFRSWTFAKMNYPSGFTDDGMELLDRLEEMLQYHEDDDQILACRGINIFQQFACHQCMDGRKDDEQFVSKTPLNTPLNLLSVKCVVKKEQHKKTPSKLKSVAQVQSNEVQKKSKVKKVIRRIRCHICEGCMRENCDRCKFCLDMPKNGGSGKLRQSCALRFCKDPQLPNYVECKICNLRKQDSGEVLMECSLCYQIVHPTCMKNKAPCKISKKVNNSWECPDCCDPHEGCEFSFDQVGGVISETKRKWQEEYSPDIKQQVPSKKAKSSNVSDEDSTADGVRHNSCISADGVLHNSCISVSNKDGESNSKDDEAGSKIVHIDKMAKMKSLLRNVKILSKVTLKPICENLASTSAAGKREINQNVTDGDQQGESSDDEPLIKKKSVDKTNHIATSSYDSTKTDLKIYRPIAVIRPAPIEPYETCYMDNDKPHILRHNIWMRIFSYLGINDKLSCMLVCKSWNQWCIDSCLWKTIDVSNKPINQSMLKGVVRRQPAVLNLSSTNINGKQLEWLLRRLPCLDSLDLSLNTASAVSAFVRLKFPPLSSLNLSWCTGIYDRFLVQILMHGNEAVEASRWKFLRELDVTGCNVSDESVIKIFTTLPSLCYLAISHCCNITDKCFEGWISGTTVCQNNLHTLVCIGCSLSETLIEKLRENLHVINE